MSEVENTKAIKAEQLKKWVNSCTVFWYQATDSRGANYREPLLMISTKYESLMEGMGIMVGPVKIRDFSVIDEKSLMDAVGGKDAMDECLKGAETFKYGPKFPEYDLISECQLEGRASEQTSSLGKNTR
ncbi:MAG: hypothetical protein CMM93_08485 [Rickettsiales bacterium]|mgnify:CR=1 FL=1|nr:hypothetical protein [Rickettsiales bacterium]|tara:strand:- start:234 stop:620 length:387 start_codon:yes stop_codon:yes gene_type:complete